MAPTGRECISFFSALYVNKSANGKFCSFLIIILYINNTENAILYERDFLKTIKIFNEEVHLLVPITQ